MIIDTSSIIAILRDENDAAVYSRAIVAGAPRRLSAGNYVECGIIVDRDRDPALSSKLDELLGTAGVIIEPVTERQALLARQAYRDFGKGSGHPAGLNFGDCFAYALAIDRREPLLWKGDDFGHTGVRSALESS
ncbi:type II toxin-antitoxin system VapC family toxin [Mycolicibacterium llatzerense]|uniref:type II toxin-antitoxin system VapC family toxin n=1 Tax=Mycolicibacterium llatzerense TaxID=280871 RepID=UPI0008DDB2CD|nr:type II toxin-antitoxin system VapC family toxin [Mycolicibacterium llatzerense]MCT7364926.1 ribonuclease [Mycolicibacterium llatzerense]